MQPLPNFRAEFSLCVAISAIYKDALYSGRSLDRIPNCLALMLLPPKISSQLFCFRLLQWGSPRESQTKLLRLRDPVPLR